MSDNENSQNHNLQSLAELTNSASVVSGATSLPFRTDVAFDIETGPILSDHDDASLLDPEQARVASIGYYLPSQGRCYISYDPIESSMLTQFWDSYMSVAKHGAKMIGFNCFGFDLPFILRRCWHHGIRVPKSAASSGRYWSWSDTFLDVMQAWRCGSYKDYISLDKLSKFLKVGQKNGSGELFYKLWQKDRPAAIEYLVNDCKITHSCAAKMGFTAEVA